MYGMNNFLYKPLDGTSCITKIFLIYRINKCQSFQLWKKGTLYSIAQDSLEPHYIIRISLLNVVLLKLIWNPCWCPTIWGSSSFPQFIQKYLWVNDSVSTHITRNLKFFVQLLQQRKGIKFVGIRFCFNKCMGKTLQEGVSYVLKVIFSPTHVS